MRKSIMGNSDGKSVTSLTPFVAATSTLAYGSRATTFIPSPIAIRATFMPTFPRPMMPKVLPLTSTPTSLLLAHFPATRLAVAAGMFLAVASSKAMVCSAAATMLPLGELTTMIPNFVAASMSTLSTPTPALATTLRFLAAASKAAVTFVSDRMINAS